MDPCSDYHTPHALGYNTDVFDRNSIGFANVSYKTIGIFNEAGKVRRVTSFAW